MVMRRDMSLIRDLMLRIESGEKTVQTLTQLHADNLGLVGEYSLTEEEASKLEYHLDLIQEVGFVAFRRVKNPAYQVERITWTGYEFLESVRDPEIWAKTQKGLEEVGGFGIELIAELAKGFARKKIKEHTGIDI